MTAEQIRIVASELKSPTYYRSEIVGTGSDSYKLVETGEAAERVKEGIARQLADLRNRTGKDYFVEVYSS